MNFTTGGMHVTILSFVVPDAGWRIQQDKPCRELAFGDFALSGSRGRKKVVISIGRNISEVKCSAPLITRGNPQIGAPSSSS